MLTKQLTLSIQIPTHTDFAAKYPPFGALAGGTGKVLTDVVLSPEAYIRAVCATELRLPAVAGVAEACANAAGRPLAPRERQLVGALIATLMEANGHHKTGSKRAIPHEQFTIGEVYKLAGLQAGLKWN